MLVLLFSLITECDVMRLSPSGADSSVSVLARGVFVNATCFANGAGRRSLLRESYLRGQLQCYLIVVLDTKDQVAYRAVR